MLISSYTYIFGDRQMEILTRHLNSDSLVPSTLFCFTLCNFIVFKSFFIPSIIVFTSLPRL